MDEEDQPTSSEPVTADYNIHRKIFVGNISYRIRSRKLQKFFSKFGEVEYSYVVKDHLKKWSRGIAFVTFKSEESMKKALVASDKELILDGRQMRVKPAELSSKTLYWQDDPADMSGDDDDEEEGEDTDAGSAANTMEKTRSHAKFTHHWTEAHGEDGMETEEDQASTPATCHIDGLFDELLERIFSLLSVKERIRVERVCHRWQHLAKRAWLAQKSLDFKNMFRRFGGLTDQNLNHVLCRCGQYLECLDLSSSPRLLTDFAMDIIAKQCPSLQQLDVSCVKITDVSLRNLVSRCSTLKTVRLKQCLHITDQGITNLLRGSPAMERLDITDLHTITGQCFQNAGENMKTLVLNNCHKMKDSSVEILTKRCGSLEELHVTNCRLLSSAAVRCISQKLPNMRCLYFSGTGSTVDSPALVCLASLQHLEALDLSQCHTVNDSVLTAISHGCYRLRELNVSSCNSITDAGMSNIVFLQHLETLDVSYLNKVTGEAFVTLAAKGRLKKLVARATKFLTDEVVVSIATLSPHLCHLDLSGCFQITNTIFEGFRSDTTDVSHTVELYVGGTSVDWIGQDVDWLSGFSHLQVFLHNRALEDLRPDRDLILPSYDSDEEEEEEVQHVDPGPAFLPEQFEGYAEDWEEDDYYDGGAGGFDDYLDNDDPLAEERWNMS